MTVAGLIHSRHNAERPGGNRADTELNHPASGCNYRRLTAPVLHTECRNARGMPMNPPHPSAANRERLLTIMAVCHRLRQPLPPRTRLAPLVGCTSRQLHRYIERLKAEGLVALERSGRGLLVQEIGR